jgi:hypothetical protein
MIKRVSRQIAGGEGPVTADSPQTLSGDHQCHNGRSQPIDTERPLFHVLLMGRPVDLQPMADFLAVLGIVAFVAVFMGLIWCLERV